MKKILKILRVVLAAVVVLIIVAVVLVYLFAGRALKTGIESAGTKALDVNVSLRDVDLSLIGGKVRLEDLVIDNPPGYQHDRLLELDDARVQVDLRSLLTDTVNIRDIRLDGIVVVLEQRGISSNNLQDVLAKLKSEEKPETEPSGKKLHIDNLEISNVTVKVKLIPIPGKVDTVTLKLKPIKMTNLGGDNKLDTVALISKILVAIAGGIAEQGVGLIPDGILNPLKDQLQNLGALSGALLKEGGKLLEKGTDLGKGVTEGLKGLFKPKEKQPQDPAQ